MTNTKTTAQAIRNELKAIRGLSPKQVSVRSDGLGASVQIRIAGLDEMEITRICKVFENVDCDAFGETLGGGNRFVSVTSYEGHELFVR